MRVVRGRREEIINGMLDLALQRGSGAPVLADGFLLYPDCGEIGRGVASEEWPGVWRRPWELWKLSTNQSRNISPTSQLAQWCHYMPTITSPAQSYGARTEMGGQPQLSSCPTLIRACSSPMRSSESLHVNLANNPYSKKCHVIQVKQACGRPFY